MIYKSPSNIAFIKYMGKGPSGEPLNPSLSYTLDKFISGVKLLKSKDNKDFWSPLEARGFSPLSLNKKEQKRFLLFFSKLKKHFGLKGFYEIRSANNFPKSLGAASSASSFSALTLACYHRSLREGGKRHSFQKLSHISGEGSGSACRSFIKPWCLWGGGDVLRMSFPSLNRLEHDGVITSKRAKKVPSSKAHQLVAASPFFPGRKKKARRRLQKWIEAARHKDLKELYLITKAEFQEMHRLFETARPPFSYQNHLSRSLLEWTERFWRDHKTGPLVTMDAGSVVHFFWLPKSEKRTLFKKMLLSKTKMKHFI